jgi:hypothetical protein
MVGGARIFIGPYADSAAMMKVAGIGAGSSMSGQYFSDVVMPKN